MTNTIKTHYVVCLLLAFMAIGVSTTAASEVTGTLSSDATSKQSPSGDIDGTVTNEADGGELNGTVTSESGNGSLTGTVTSEGGNGSLTGTVQSEASSGGSSGGTRIDSGSGGSQATPNTPSGAVLGVTNDDLNTPNFPNAGVASATTSSGSTFWSTLMTFLGNVLS